MADRVIGVATDITERVRVEEELKQQRESFRVTLASIGDAVIATDAASKITFMNAEAEELTGWTTKEASGQPITQVFHIVNEQTRQRVESPVARVIAEGVVVGLANHTILLRKDGTEVPIDDSGAPIKDASGSIIGVVLVFRNIAIRKSAEATQQKTLQDLHALVSNIHSAILFVGENGIELANQAFCDYFGLSERPVDLIGLTAAEMINKIKNAYLDPEKEGGKPRHTGDDSHPHPADPCHDGLRRPLPVGDRRNAAREEPDRDAALLRVAARTGVWYN